jgi:DNA-nicking Smr family endonuclease
MQRSSKRGEDIVPDFSLWEELRKTAKPLQTRKNRTGPVAKPQREMSPPQLPARPRAPAAAGPRPRAPAASASAYAFTGLDRRTAQKLTRGKIAIDARIDLHGMGAEEARHRLLAFLSQSRARGHLTVLVITGKGASPFTSHTLHGRTPYHAPERQGRLRLELSHWMAEAEFRRHVTGYQPAHPRHGGGGAFYVRLRRAGRFMP